MKFSATELCCIAEGDSFSPGVFLSISEKVSSSDMAVRRKCMVEIDVPWIQSLRKFLL